MSYHLQLYVNLNVETEKEARAEADKFMIPGYLMRHTFMQHAAIADRRTVLHATSERLVLGEPVISRQATDPAYGHVEPMTSPSLTSMRTYYRITKIVPGYGKEVMEFIDTELAEDLRKLADQAADPDRMPLLTFTVEEITQQEYRTFWEGYDRENW